MRRKLSIIREQEYQDKFCIYYGLPPRMQNGIGIDYYDETCGWLEFVLDSQLETKDISKYPQLVGEASQANARNGDKRYAVIFLRKPPNSYDVITMGRLGVSWYFWASPEDTDDDTFVKNDSILVMSGLVEKSALLQPESNQQDTET